MSATKDIFEYLCERASVDGEKAVRDAIRDFNSRKRRALQAGKKVEARKRMPKAWVRAAFARQDGMCARCGEPMDLGEKDPKLRVTGDHDDAHSTGGEHSIENTVAMHQRCNSAKGNRDFYTDCKRTGQSLLERNRLKGNKE